MPRKKPVKKRAAPKRVPAKKRARLETLRFGNTDIDPIIENLKEVAAKYNQVRNIDTEILEQVALEGLTGTTFSRLCLILDAVIRNLNSSNDDAAQDYIWSVLVNGFMRRTPGASIQVFHLNPQLQNSPIRTQNSESENTQSTQNKSYCIDKPIKLPKQSLKRMAKSDWMLHPVLDNHIMGSCPNYTCRENISQEVMRLYDELGPRESLLVINEKFDLEKIYFVADQEVRRRALLPKSYDPNIDLKLREYACLELIGQTRCFGMVFPNDKTLGRYRILLTAKGLITQYQETCQTYIVHHLRKFYQFNIEVGVKAFKIGQIVSAKPRVQRNCDEEDDDEFDIEADMGATIKGTCCNPARLKCDRDVLKMVYDTIAMSKGRSLLDIRRKLRFPKSHIRNHLKNLANTELIGSHTKLLFDKKTRIYRARHKSNRRRMLIARQRKPIRGVMAKWDEADVRARQYLGLRRSSFSQAEDSLLTLCRITGLLLDPTYPKTFTVPKQIIRDILHDELPESYDKTSDALLRRVKFLGRLDRNILLINEITAELSDDADVKRIIDSAKDLKKTDEKRCTLFQQLFQVIRAKLPHLLGLTSSLLTDSSFEIESFDDLTKRFELIDCQRTSARKKTYHQPLCTLVQLVRSTTQCYRLKLTKCEDMPTVMLISSRCTQTCFDLRMKLKFPIRAVALDHDNANFRVIFEKAKESKEASRMIANLTTTNPSADSRRALFMLRNAPKLQNMDKCGKLTDALIIQPCEIEFFSDEEITFDGRDLINNFLNTSKFSNETRNEHKGSQAKSVERNSQTNQRQIIEKPKLEICSDGATTSTAAEAAGASASCSRNIPASSASLNKQNKLFKMIESIMSWVGAFPGIELNNLKTKLAPLLGVALDEHLSELLELMESLELISRNCSAFTEDMCRKPCLFGYKTLTEQEHQPVITFEPRENAYVRLCQLIDVEL